MSFIIFIIYGIISIFLQIFFLREFIPVFHGNEFVIGIIIGHWLFAAAAANYVFQYVNKTKDVLNNTIKLFFLLMFFILSSFVFIRSVNMISNTDITQGISLKTSFIYSFIAIFPVSFTLNFLLNLLKICFASVLYQKKVKRYICEAIGFVIGGIIFSFYMPAISTVSLLLITGCLICLGLIYLCESRELKFFFVLIIIFLIYVIQNFSGYVEKMLISNNYSGNNIIDISYYKNVQNILTEKNGEFYFYTNGVCEFSLPSPDIFEEEDFAHLPILHHSAPQNILLAGGIKYLPSIIKYDFKEIDFVEDNKNAIDTIRKHIGKLDNVFNDRRIKIYNYDARLFLKNSDKKYDVILLGFNIPINTDINKFYTYEFFDIVSDKLTDDGFVALRLPGSMVYSASLMAELNSSVYNALKGVFKYIKIIPGKENILISSKSPMPFRLHIKKRLKNIEDETFVLSKYYIDERMDTQKTKWLNFQIRKDRNKRLVNTDENQKAVIFSIMYWQSAFSPLLMKFFRELVEYSYFIIFIAVILFFAIRFKYTVTSFVSGASAMWLQMICFWGFQIYVGQIYQWFGLMTAIFMCGLVCGSLYSKYYHKSVALNKTFFNSEILYLLWILTFIVIIKYGLANIYSLSMLSFGIGTITGLEFAQLIKMFGIMKEGVSNARIFAADAFGGCFASYVGGAFIIPVLGIEKSLMFVLLLKFLIFTWWQYDKKHGL